MKRHTIIGTAGHIDHGKTALIKAITGIDADRLKEEKERGITIDIGFAYWKDEVTIIDVPGHEKFVRNMVAGVSTIDFFMLVIAADDGIMPQTIEHLDILNFFNIRDGIVVINKIDLVDTEWLELLQEEIQEFLQKYDLNHLPVVAVSAVSGKNIDQLKSIIEQKINELQEHESTRPFRLFVDRSFSIKGFGTVVTGTVLSGRIKKGDEVQILPSGKISKVRGIQTHIHDVDSVNKGERAAINLQSVAKDEVTRGDVLSKPQSLTAVTEFSGKMKTVSKIPIKVMNRSRVRVYTGTAEKMGQIIWYDNLKTLQENEEYHVRIKVDEPLSAARDDVFLIRLHSPVLTLAGGKIVELNPPRIRHQPEHWRSYFKKMSEDNRQNVIEEIIRNSGMAALSVKDLQHQFFESQDLIKIDVTTLVKRNHLREISLKGVSHFIHENNFARFLESILEKVKSFHHTNPHKQGLNLNELFTSLGKKWIAEEVFESAIKKLVNSHELKSEHNLYSLYDFKIKIGTDTDKTIQQILDKFKTERFSPPDIEQLAAQLEMDKKEVQSLLGVLVKEKKLISITVGIYLHSEVFIELLEFLKNYFSKNDDMPVSALKDFIQTSRKFAIPIFEFLDSEGYTARFGDIRKTGPEL